MARGNKPRINRSLFELTHIPKWHVSTTPELETSHLHTPLRRPLRNREKDTTAPKGERFTQPVTPVLPPVELSINDSDSDIPYNYKPFFDKDFVSESKIENLLRTERAEHCLIFHKASHGSLVDYRPDLNLECEGEGQNSDSWDNGLLNSKKNLTNSNIRPTTTLTSRLSKRDKSSNELQGQVTRQLDQLYKFWDYSPLADELNDDLILRLSKLVHKEMDHYAFIRSSLSTSLTSGSLRSRCNKIYKMSRR